MSILKEPGQPDNSGLVGEDHGLCALPNDMGESLAKFAIDHADDPGSVSIVFRLAAVTATQSQKGGNIGSAAISEFFAVEPNATLVPITATSRNI